MDPQAESSNLFTHPIYGSLAQLAEHLTLNQRVTGSIPVRSTIYGSLAQLAEHLTLNQRVTGSIPV